MRILILAFKLYCYFSDAREKGACQLSERQNEHIPRVHGISFLL